MRVVVKKTSIPLRLPEVLVAEMDAWGQRTGENRSILMRRAIRELLDRENRTGSVAR